jgi:hypothetical protein
MAYSSIPSTSITKFVQATAPSNWTKVTTYNDYMLRVVSGSPGTGGSSAFSTVFSTRSTSGTRNISSLTANPTSATSPSHTHPNGSPSLTRPPWYPNPTYSVLFNNPTTSPTPAPIISWPGSTTGGSTNSSGSGNGHTHTITTPSTLSNPATITTPLSLNFAINYVDVILAQRN